MANLSGFRQFFERTVNPYYQSPDQQPYGYGKDGTMDSIAQTAWELGVPEKAMVSVPDVFSNIQIGHKIRMGPSTYEVLEIGPKSVKVRLHDDGSKRLIKTPGALYNDPSKPEEKIIDIPRAYFVKMRDDQYAGASGAMAGPGGGLPPMV